MASNSLADQLDDAIEMMIAEPDSAPPKVDLRIDELLGIAADLRLLPDPEFRATLKAELLGQSYAVPVVASVNVRRELTKRVPGNQSDWYRETPCWLLDRGPRHAFAAAFGGRPHGEKQAQTCSENSPEATRP